MGDFIAALPMYDWPEARGEVDAEWAAIRNALRSQGLDAPEHLTRRNADLPPVPGGIRDGHGALVAPDPATLPPHDLDLGVVWRHPTLLFAQTCWGPLELGLAPFVRVVGQPDYSVFEGGAGELYSSAILMRAGDAPDAPSLRQGDGVPVERLQGRRFARNGPDSMSGWLALSRDLETLGLDAEALFTVLDSGSHRASVRWVAEGRADVCAVDCRSWSLAQRFEPGAAALRVVGWTALRPGLPFVAARRAPSYAFGAT